MNKTLKEHQGETVFFGSQCCTVYRFSVSEESRKALDFIRRFFNALLINDITPDECKRNKFTFEYAYQSVMVMARLYAYSKRKSPIVIGSRFLSKTNWAVFAGKTDIPSEHVFPGFSDLIDYYDDLLWENHETKLFYFLYPPKAIEKIAEECLLSCNVLFNIAILLMRDIIFHAGPDCEDFFDLFSNDVRVEHDSWDIYEWERLRCRYLGRFGSINFKSSHCLPSLEETIKKTYRVAFFESIACGTELFHGEKTYPAHPNKMFYVNKNNLPDSYEEMMCGGA